MPARVVVVPLVSLGQEDDGVVTVVGGDDHLHDLDLPVVALSSGLCGGERAPVKGVGVRAIGRHSGQPLGLHGRSNALCPDASNRRIMAAVDGLEPMSFPGGFFLVCELGFGHYEQLEGCGSTGLRLLPSALARARLCPLGCARCSRPF